MGFLSDPVTFLIDSLRALLLGWGLLPEWTDFVLALVGAGILPLLAMLWVIFLIWYERKLIGRIQDRPGPNRVGPYGLIQPFADMLKIFTKEFITPSGVDWLPYNLAPVLNVAAVLMIWAVIPFTMTVMGTNLNVGVLYIIATGGFGILSILLAGWGSDNKYALLAGFRAVAQMVSYEVPMVVALLVPVMLSGSLGVNEIVKAQEVWFVFSAPAAALVFFLCSMAEVGRAPFDLVEAESELVAGFNIEYSGLKFGMFYVGEFLHAFTISLMFSTLFLGGWRGPGAEQVPVLGFVYLVIKTFVVYLLVILFRGSLPRLRIDQMMDFNWKVLVPLSLAVVVVTALVDKALAGTGIWLRALALLLANGGLLFVAATWVDRGQSRRPRPVVTPERFRQNHSAQTSAGKNIPGAVE